MSLTKGWIALIIATLLILPLGHLEAKVVERIVAKVNEEIITLSELNESLASLIFPSSGEFEGIEGERKLKELRRQALDQLINDKLILLEAKRVGLEISKEEVARGIGEIKKRFKSEKEFHEALKAKGMSIEDLEKNVKEQLLQLKMVDREVRSQIQVKEEEVKDFYSKNREKYMVPGGIKIRHILLKVSPQASVEVKAQVLAKAKDLREQLKKGMDFAELARQYSEDEGTREKGGYLGYLTREEMIPELAKIAFLLKVGEVSDPLESEYGYHLIKVEERDPERYKEYSLVKDEIKRELIREGSEARFKEWIKKLRERAKIEVWLD